MCIGCTYSSIRPFHSVGIIRSHWKEHELPCSLCILWRHSCSWILIISGAWSEVFCKSLPTNSVAPAPCIHSSSSDKPRNLKRPCFLVTECGCRALVGRVANDERLPACLMTTIKFPAVSNVLAIFFKLTPRAQLLESVARGATGCFHRWNVSHLCLKWACR